MEFLCLAPSSHNFTTSPKLTPFSTNRIITTTTLRDMKMYRNMRGSRVKTLAKPLKLSNLFYPSDLVSDPSCNLPEPGQLIEHKPTGGDREELLQYLFDMLASPVYDVAIESPLEKAEKISKKLGVNFFIKREDKQEVFSFKLRGAYNMISRLPEEQLKKGIITASAGNHAQGVALSSYKKCPATIVMPTTTPQIKIDAVKSLNPDADVPLRGQNFDEALAIALEIAKEKDFTFIPPYDDPEIIKGQGTIGVEINRQLKDIYAIFVPVGGGGLISGIAAYMKQIAPKTKIIGVEPYGAASMTYALYKGKPEKLPWPVDNFADGVAVGKAGEYTFKKCNELIDGMVLVHREGISAGIKDVYDQGREILETSGAVSIAGAEAYCNYYDIKDKNIVAIASGANMDFSKLKLVAELAPIGAGTEALLATTVPDKPGSFLEFTNVLGSFSVTEFTYRYCDQRKHAVFLYSIDLTGKDHPDVDDVIVKMNSAGFNTVDFSHHDLAKEHLRHLVAGGVSNVSDEIYVQFVFPEIQGALNKFLNAFSPRWNITLFRYRSQREIDASVLVGFQVPQSEMDEFKNQANKLGYPYAFESLDEAAKLIVE